jgi:hypothetical protein
VLVLVLVVVLDLVGFGYDYEDEDEHDALQVRRVFTPRGSSWQALPGTSPAPALLRVRGFPDIALALFLAARESRCSLAWPPASGAPQQSRQMDEERERQIMQETHS